MVFFRDNGKLDNPINSNDFSDSVVKKMESKSSLSSILGEQKGNMVSSPSSSSKNQTQSTPINPFSQYFKKTGELVKSTEKLDRKILQTGIHSNEKKNVLYQSLEGLAKSNEGKKKLMSAVQDFSKKKDATSKDLVNLISRFSDKEQNREDYKVAEKFVEEKFGITKPKLDEYRGEIARKLVQNQRIADFKNDAYDRMKGIIKGVNNEAMKQAGQFNRRTDMGSSISASKGSVRGSSFIKLAN